MISQAALTRVFERLLDILPLEVWISVQDLLERGAVRDLSHDDRNGNPHASDGGAAPHDLRIKCNAIEQGYLLSGDDWGIVSASHQSRPQVNVAIS